MAATKKALEIQLAKTKVVEEIKAVREQIRQACGRVPEWIARADATESAAWRDCAESELVRVSNFPVVSGGGNSLNKLRDILARDRSALGLLL
ncbi:hypothetical protein EJ774_21275 [Pandoraea apista]|uniref:Uncharacterized protein n=1 Tax=Pandoraea apista TaxID=93218 RepID=A0ABX9ZM46_9BURK|nr:hypothetical protein [Pandoraea apista]RSK77888.1 hypothetical protein EJE83_18040 [Pandoraea apista]RUN81875.1 hypothetical protein EJ774_21275 [Pandoraea apista]